MEYHSRTYKYILLFSWLFIGVLFTACNQQVAENENDASLAETGDSISVIDADLVESSQPDQTAHSATDLGSKIVNYAGTLAGIPYKEAGRDTTGFDCSGFVHYVFNKYNIDIPHSSRHIAQIGEEISIEDAKQGDLVIFRGTDPASTEAGHVGIVVSGTGEKIRFIHSSSALSSPCVRFDSLDKPNYQRRFLMIKRVLQ